MDTAAFDTDALEPVWLTRARHYLAQNTAETPSLVTDNPLIGHFHSYTAAGRPKHPDVVAWCSSFANCCMQESAILGTRSKAARSWCEWGVDLLPEYRVSGKIRKGAVLVFSRGLRPTQGHVAFAVGQPYQAPGHGGSWILVLGGNQGNRVSIAPRSMADLIAMRWPKREDMAL